MERWVRGERRAATNTLGYVLLLGLVIASTSLLFVVGGDAIQQVQSQSRTETGEILVQEVDAKLGSVASATGDAASAVELGDKRPDQVTVRQSGTLELRVNGGACTETFPLSSVVYSDDTDETVAYQAGGIWRQAPDGGSVMVAPPDVTFQNRSLNVRLVDVDGEVNDDRFRTVKNQTASRLRTEAARAALLAGECARPSTVTLRVTSAYHEAWARYLESEVGTTVSTVGPETVELTLTQSDLPEAVDDSRNEVVNLSDASLVEPDPVAGQLPGDEFSIDKAVDNSYFVSARTLPSGAAVSDIETFDGGEILRRPVDVVVVMDESGSMGGSKIADARDAAKRFVGLTNASRDRVAFVGYTTDSRYVLVDGERYFGSDHDALNATIDGYSAGGGTEINLGLNASLDVQDVKSNASRDRHVILLSDGNNSGDSPRAVLDARTLAGAEDAAKQDIVVHTIAFGSSPDEQLMKDVANATGGTYSRAETGSDLESVFESIFKSITESEQIVNYPVSTRLSIDGTTFYPSAAGDTSSVASASGYPNVNDPSFSGNFTYATDTGDGLLMEMAAVRLACSDWELTGIEQTNGTTGETFNEVRCAEATGVAETLPASNVTVYLDGADVSSLKTVENAWWQPDLYNDTLGPYRAGDELDLESNEAIVVYDYGEPAAGEGSNRLVMRYEFGLPESTQTASVLDVSVTEVTIDD